MSHYFVAVPITAPLKKEYASWQDILKEELDYKVWPHEQDLHITLKFLGEADENRIAMLKKELDEKISCQAFTIDTGGIGIFGKTDQPRVMWAGVRLDPRLAELQEQTEAACAMAGFAVEKRAFRPHITLAKKWKGTERLAGDKWRMLQTRFETSFPLLVEEAVLYRIHPSETPKYEIVARFPLDK